MLFRSVEIRILKTRLRPASPDLGTAPAMAVDRDTGQLVVRCADSSGLQVLDAQVDGKPFTPAGFLSRFGPDPIKLPVT